MLHLRLVIFKRSRNLWYIVDRFVLSILISCFSELAWCLRFSRTRCCGEQFIFRIPGAGGHASAAR